MKFKLAGTLMVATILSAGVPAWADDSMSNEGKFFGKLYGGASILGDQSISQTGVAAPGATSDASFDAGMVAGGAAGYYFTDNISAELAWDYRSNNLDKANFSDGTNFNDGDFASNIFFVNGYYHLDPIMNSKFRPYVGAGLGYVQEIDIDLKNTGGAETSYSQDGEIAYQLIAGTSYGLTNNWDLTADIRYMRADGINLKTESGGTAELRNVDYDPVSLTVGAVYKF
jgi:outer membrane protein W